jgi:hypothetical protein
MNNFRNMAVACGLSALAVGSAHADDSNWGIGLKAGTLGLGLEGRWAPLPYLDLRLGGNTYDLAADDRYADVEYEATFALQNYYATANFRFPLSPFRVTAGIFSNGNELNMVSAEPGDFSIGGDFYTAAEVGTLASTTSFPSAAPYFGVGFDFELFGKAGLNFDFGVLWQGDPDVALVAAGGTLVDDPTFQASLEAERLALEDEISNFKAYPVVSLSIVYNF